MASRAPLDAALLLHRERHGERHWEHKREEAAALLQRTELKLTERLRLERLRDELLPVLDAWMEGVDAMQEERDELLRYADGARPSDAAG